MSPKDPMARKQSRPTPLLARIEAHGPPDEVLFVRRGDVAQWLREAYAEAYKLGYANGWHAGPSADYDDDIANARRPE